MIDFHGIVLDVEMFAIKCKNKSIINLYVNNIR